MPQKSGKTLISCLISKIPYFRVFPLFGGIRPIQTLVIHRVCHVDSMQRSEVRANSPVVHGSTKLERALWYKNGKPAFKRVLIPVSVLGT